ncbi:granulocyte colony-stimulating factor receptor-like [Emydura macquarii macquarii]|uniref:granulocyte colony-stimulating factor receptor-like n=1 Tax=Emydura macquarii macquarii TaxID=1129001 RepID=UPI00352B0793
MGLNLMLSWMFSLVIAESGANSTWHGPGSRVPTPLPSCGMLSLHPTVACLGTLLTASCFLDPSCLQSGPPRLGDIIWRLNGETRQLPLSQSIAGNGTVAAVTVLWAEQPRGQLSCYLPHGSSLHLLGMAEYQAGVPPGDLQVEYCVSLWEGNITCYWDPGPETYLPTTYTLHITEEAGPCLWKFRDAGTCLSSRESSSCTIPVENLFAAFKVRLTAVNPLGHASAPDKCMHGMSIVKLSSPEVSATADRSDCFCVAWWQPNEELLRVTDARYEIRYRDVDEASWLQVDFTAAEDAPPSKDICGVSPFTNYSVQVRAIYQNEAFRWSEGGPSWSDWSPASFVMTLPAAPSRGPALWRRIATPDADERREIVLMWKPLQSKEASGRILTYSLRWQRRGQPAILACLTRSLQCALELPASEEHIFFLTASNAVGESPATKLSIPAEQAPAVQGRGGEKQTLPALGQRGVLKPSPGCASLPSIAVLLAVPLLPVLVSPASDRSLLLQWDPPGFAAAAYIFEWDRASENRGHSSSWSYEPGNISKVVLAEAIEPGYLYNLTVFALSDGAVRAAGSASAYSKQIAPFRAPTLRPTRVWPSQVEVQWEEIPLEERGGFIQHYTISYEEQGKDTQAVVVNSSVHRYLIVGLAPDSVVGVSISVTSGGGSTQGSIHSIRTGSFDHGEIELWLSTLCGGLIILLIATALACILKHPLIQGYVWPQVPDPAKSHLASWLPPKMWLNSGNFSAEQSKQQGPGLSNFLCHGASRIICGQQEEMMLPESFLESTGTAEASTARDKYKQPLQNILLLGDVTTLDHAQARSPEPASYQSKVEYSAVIVWVYPGDVPPDSGAPWPQSGPRSPEISGPSHAPGWSICFQSPSSEAPGGSCWQCCQQPDGGLASLDAFPLLRSLAVEGCGDSPPNGDHSAGTLSPGTP